MAGRDRSQGIRLLNAFVGRPLGRVDPAQLQDRAYVGMAAADLWPNADSSCCDRRSSHGACQLSERTSGALEVVEARQRGLDPSSSSS